MQVSFFGARQRSLNLAKEEYGPRLLQAKREFDQAQVLLDLNPERSRELIRSVRTIVTDLAEDDVDDPELSILKSQLEENIENILGEYVVEPDLHIDLSLVSEGFVGTQMYGFGDTALILDSVNNKIISSMLSTKKTEVIAGPDEASGAKAIAAYADNVYLVKDEGIVDLETSDTKIEKEWGEILLSTFAGNIYILDKDSSSVWRYSAIKGGFGSKQNWFGPGVNPDLSNTVSWAIDGAIWILTRTGEVRKFSLGREESISDLNIGQPLDFPVAIFTSEDAQDVYVLDPPNSRVVVISKSGDFLAQYLADDLNGAKGLVVSEDIKKIIYLKGSALKSIELKHLK